MLGLHGGHLTERAMPCWGPPGGRPGWEGQSFENRLAIEMGPWENLGLPFFWLVPNLKVLITDERVEPKKRTPRISAEMAIHEVRCANCKKVARTCHVASTGESCYECRRGKVKCSHVGVKGNKKTAAPSPPLPPPPPPAPAPKPKPRPKPVASTSRPVRACSKATQVPGQAARTQTKSSEPAAVAPAQPRAVPGPRCVNNAYVELRTCTKRKIAAVEEEESESEDGEEEAYLAGRVSGLSNILQMIEMACATMRKEVEEIDGQVTKRRRRRR
ncbi:uncharacterized protein F5891DRAFT_1194024 [Suillus fuscotomentosus]|uniref:Zn(2)-C6 fungal-type domain-containing protein n=1 Tax=Suillus fuscotomentosus TaxID=1912939 RepID=A0AAD4HGH2_9AGAM|nr:uncharacterized protein F5891DRAFT_1194024 [Suillus fuscotomentosus]KAG1895693.1 hypothetical protein F5891DRAFT_1194024 [Suillus fuscotomentosus]